MDSTVLLFVGMSVLLVVISRSFMVKLSVVISLPWGLCVMVSVSFVSTVVPSFVCSVDTVTTVGCLLTVNSVTETLEVFPVGSAIVSVV